MWESRRSGDCNKIPDKHSIFFFLFLVLQWPEFHPIAPSRFLLSAEGVITTRSNRMKCRLVCIEKIPQRTEVPLSDVLTLISNSCPHTKPL